METLRAYLSQIDPAAQADYARRAGTTIGYLRKALSTRPRLDGALVRRLDEESHGAVCRSDLRPDIWPPEQEKDSADLRPDIFGHPATPQPPAEKQA